jgi:hypothetical protein
MGLDMYAFTTTRAPEAAVDFEFDNATPLHSWRKHSCLHGWMEALYLAKGGGDPLFRGATLALDATDLQNLAADLRAGDLPETDGLFFGTSAEADLAQDLAFIRKARRALRQGQTVFYQAIW